MNRKGQDFGWIRLLFYGGFFLIVFAIGLAPMVAASLGPVDFSDYGPFGAWVLSHMNVWFFGVFVLAVLIALIFGLATSE